MGKVSYFPALCVNISKSKTVEDSSKVTINVYHEVAYGLSIDTKCRNFAWFRNFGREQRL